MEFLPEAVVIVEGMRSMLLAVVSDMAAALQLRNIVSSLMYSGGATDVPAFVPIAFLSLHPSHVDHVPVPQCAMARQK